MSEILVAGNRQTRAAYGTASPVIRFPAMEKYAAAIFILLAAIAAASIYASRPTETPEQFAHRTCNEDPPTGVTYERCIEGRTLQRLAGRKDEER